MSDESANHVGGEGGGAEVPVQPEKLVLRRSELAILRQMGDLYPTSEKERREIVEIVLDTTRTAKSRRTKLAGARTLAVLQQASAKEIANYITAKRTIRDELEPSPSPSVVVQVNQETTVVQQAQAVAASNTERFLDEYADIIDEEAGVPARPDADDGVGEQVHPPATNGKAGPLPD